MKHSHPHVNSGLVFPDWINFEITTALPGLPSSSQLKTVPMQRADYFSQVVYGSLAKRFSIVGARIFNRHEPFIPENKANPFVVDDQ